VPDMVFSFNQLWILTTDFHKSPQYNISRKSIQWKLCQTWQSYRLLFIFIWTCLKILAEEELT